MTTSYHSELKLDRFVYYRVFHEYRIIDLKTFQYVRNKQSGKILITGLEKRAKKWCKLLNERLDKSEPPTL
jgi:hypothetical protein